jgi:hypothetical protein
VILATRAPNWSADPGPYWVLRVTGGSRDDYIPDHFSQGQTVLASGHRGGDSISLVLVRARGHTV